MKKLFALIALAAPALAFAHPGHGDSGLLNGLLHPITGLDHILAMLAVGLWAASFGGKARWTVPTAFVSMMAAGFAFSAGGGEMISITSRLGASEMFTAVAREVKPDAPEIDRLIEVGGRHGLTVVLPG